jgi:hypothetical protein
VQEELLVVGDCLQNVYTHCLHTPEPEELQLLQLFWVGSPLPLTSRGKAAAMPAAQDAAVAAAE